MTNKKIPDLKTIISMPPLTMIIQQTRQKYSGKLHAIRKHKML